MSIEILSQNDQAQTFEVRVDGGAVQTVTRQWLDQNWSRNGRKILDRMMNPPSPCGCE